MPSCRSVAGMHRCPCGSGSSRGYKLRSMLHVPMPKIGSGSPTGVAGPKVVLTQMWGSHGIPSDADVGAVPGGKVVTDLGRVATRCQHCSEQHATWRWMSGPLGISRHLYVTVDSVCVALERGHAGEERTLPGTNPTPEDICKWKGLEQGANLQRKSRPSVLSDFPRLGSPSSAYPFIRLHDNLQGPSLLL
ncbi:uncharacterized protein PSANT_04813 [Moesziomyces antarcticus]|uniref:Uncharacterized protein n=1 Tax=Pseudozyma antarctica TaxID=84753 RepID=A0A5C3FSF3_PSEA2|nr:uncharacterized protein PSANT_04813 [Moesziomyces antarcticus]